MLHAIGAEGGILLNGQRAAWAILEDGDRVQVGDDSFRFAQAGDGEPAMQEEAAPA